MNEQQQQIDDVVKELNATKASLVITAGDVNTLVAASAAQASNITALNLELEALKAAQPQLDLSGLTAVADAMNVTATETQRVTDNAVANLAAASQPAAQ